MEEGKGVYYGGGGALQAGDGGSKDAADNDIPRFQSYGDIVAGIRRRSEVSPEQEERESKRRRAMMVLGALSDGIAGIANIFSAREGAVPVRHDPVTDRLDAWYKDILDERRRLRRYWDDAETRARMADLSGKLSDEREKRRYDMMSETERKRYNDEEEPYGAGRPGTGVLPSVEGYGSSRIYDNVTGKGKKPTGIDW